MYQCSSFSPVLHRASEYLAKRELTNNDMTLIYMDAIGVSTQGFINAIVWLSNPTVYKMFKMIYKRVYWKCCKVPQGTRIIILPSDVLDEQNESITLLPRVIETHMTDNDQDIQHIDTMLRTNIITCLLLGIKKSVRNVTLFSKPAGH